MTRDVKQGLGPGPDTTKPTPSGWVAAAGLVERWLARSERVDTVLEGLAANLEPQERARAQQLFYGVVRWASRLEAALSGLMARPPRTKVRAVLLIAGFELLEQQGADSNEQGEGRVAKIIHHAVERAKSVCSPKEAGLVNAVARKLATRLAEPPADLATEFAHPEWLVARWTRQFGAETTRKLLAWNQQPAPVHVRWRVPGPAAPFLRPTRWPGYFEVPAGHWDEVRRLANDGSLYIQDPSTRLCVDLLAPQAGEIILDACAAPGGKSLLIADTMQSGKVVALDEPAPPGQTDIRLVRLRENLSRAPSTVEVALVEADLLKVGTEFYRNLNLPTSYDAVLLDAPCSNTGVMRHRIDVKWRLQDGDFARHAEQQVSLLHSAARLVRPGGRLVYSTCSVDAAENDAVIKNFLSSRVSSRCKLARSVQAFPWADGHDGAGAYLIECS
jgi:16S rRNA (cytosine967-C5)-methyltransferase